MARIQHLIIILLLSLPAFLPNTAFADYPKTLVGYKLIFNGVTYAGYQEACTAFVNAKRSAYPSENIAQTSCSEVVIQAAGWSGGSTSYSSAINKMGSCAGVVTQWGTGTCTGTEPPVTCSAPKTRDSVTNTCVCPTGDAGYQGFPQSADWSSATATTSNSNRYTCNNGCTAKLKSDGQTWLTEGTSIYGDAAFTGASCSVGTGSNAPPSSSNNAPSLKNCADQGKGYGTYNGIGMCVSIGSTGSTPAIVTQPPTTTTTTAVDGTKTTTTAPAVSVSVSGGSAATGGQPTVTSETTNADGTKTTTTESKDSYCQKNPNAKICKGTEDSSFASECNNGASNVACTGDSIQCAIAKAQADNRCADIKQDNLNQLGERLTTGTTTNGDLGGTDKIGVPLEIPIGSLNTSSFLPKGCLPDMSFSIGAHAIVLPLSRLCDGLQTAGKIVLAFAYMLAARIIFT